MNTVNSKCTVQDKSINPVFEMDGTEQVYQNEKDDEDGDVDFVFLWKLSILNEISLWYCV